MSKREIGACLVCGKPIQYFEKAKKMECMICHQQFESYASCEDGHYVCDSCHAEKGIQAIMDGCKKTSSTDPIRIVQELMEDPYIYMHGPEHHVMVGAALLTAYHNCGGEIGLEEALEEMKSRGTNYPGGSCGLWGCCGAAVSTGMFMSILTKATPLTGRSWRLSNRMTARALAAIAELGGPRCCKRNTYTAIIEAAKLVREEFGIEMELPETIQCRHSEENQQCLKQHCPYFQLGT